MMTEGNFSIVSLNVSERVGERKTPAAAITLRPAHGIEGDAHARDWHRQVSLLADEDVDAMRQVLPTIVPGDFAENVTTRGVDLASLPVGAVITMGEAVLEVTQIGKECHGDGCATRKAVGDCVMPRRGIFAKVIKGGEVTVESRCSYRF